MKKWFGVILTIVIIGLIGLIILDHQKVAAPAFSTKSLQGKTISHDHLQGKVTLINFWFPTCPGCVSEMPKLIKMAQDYQTKDFQIIAVAVPLDPLSMVQEYTKQRALPFDVVFDEHKTITQLFVKKDLFPTSVLLNKQGQILNTFVGEPDFVNLYQTVDSELAK